MKQKKFTKEDKIQEINFKKKVAKLNKESNKKLKEESSEKNLKKESERRLKCRY